MRLLALYLRSRAVPVAAAAAAVGAAAMWTVGQATDVRGLRLAVALLAILATVGPFGPGLVGADPELERTAAVAWPPRRAAHLAAVVLTATGLAVAVGQAAAGRGGEPLAALEVMVRDTVGLGGLLALGAVTLGAQWAWLPPTAWILVVLLFGPASAPRYEQVLTWPMQPAGTASATVTAGALAAAGLLAYAFRGARR